MQIPWIPRSNRFCCKYFYKKICSKIIHHCDVLGLKKFWGKKFGGNLVHQKGLFSKQDKKHCHRLRKWDSEQLRKHFRKKLFVPTTIVLLSMINWCYFTDQIPHYFTILYFYFLGKKLFNLLTINNKYDKDCKYYNIEDHWLRSFANCLIKRPVKRGSG